MGRKREDSLLPDSDCRPECQPEPVLREMFSPTWLLFATTGSLAVIFMTDLSPLPWFGEMVQQGGFVKNRAFHKLFESGDPFADIIAWVFFGFGIMSGLSLIFMDAPYGGTFDSKWEPSIQAKWGWVIMEAPAPCVFAYLFFTNIFLNAQELSTLVVVLQIVFFVMWEFHYLYRAFVFPFRQTGAQKPMSLFVCAMAVWWNFMNGWLNGFHLYALSDHPQLESNWLIIRTLLGMFLFWTGMYINRKSDSILRNLREPGETGYKIPRGGMFDYVSKANYYGELLEWGGFGIATWNVASFLFFINTFANLVPRAVREHRRNKERFKDYPLDRKAIFPYLL